MEIIVPLDGSPFAERALPVATDIASDLDADIHLLSAVATADDVEPRQRELAEIWFPPSRRVHRTVVVDLDPAGAIHETRRRLHAALCMASHGRGRSAALLGSVAVDVVARGRDPLVVVGRHVDTDVRGHGLLACVDNDPASASLVEATLGWADLLQQPVTVATVAELVPEPLRPVPAWRRFGPGEDVDAFLADITTPARHDGHDVEALVILEPVSVAEGVRRYLHECPATLVAVASRARTGPARFVFGSISAAIIDSSPNPVLVVPWPRDALRAP